MLVGLVSIFYTACWHANKISTLPFSSINVHTLSLLEQSCVLGGLFGNTQNKGFGFSSGLGAGTAAGATGFGTGLGTTSLGGFGGFNIQPTQQQQPGDTPSFQISVCLHVKIRRL